MANSGDSGSGSVEVLDCHEKGNRTVVRIVGTVHIKDYRNRGICESTTPCLSERSLCAQYHVEEDSRWLSRMAEEDQLLENAPISSGLF